MIRPTPKSTLFPYTTLFRSKIQQTKDIGNKIELIQTPQEIKSRSTGQEPHQCQSIKKNLKNKYTSVKRFEHRSEEHTSELQSLRHLVCRLLLEKKKKKQNEY